MITGQFITLDSITNYSNIDYHREVAKNIRKKVLKAKAGYEAAHFYYMMLIVY